MLCETWGHTAFTLLLGTVQNNHSRRRLDFNKKDHTLFVFLCLLLDAQDGCIVTEWTATGCYLTFYKLSTGLRVLLNLLLWVCKSAAALMIIPVHAFEKTTTCKVIIDRINTQTFQINLDISYASFIDGKFNGICVCHLQTCKLGLRWLQT